MTRSAKHWTWTLNNYTNDEKEQLADKATELLATKRLIYLVYGEEIAPTTNTPHLQGYIAFNSRLTLRQVKQILPSRSHLEPSRGSPAQNATYCKKDGTFTEYGSCPGGSGTRSDLVKLYADIKDGKSAEQIADAYPSHYLRYRNNILAAIRDLQPHRDWMPDNIIFWGRSGAGKTRKVFDSHPHTEIYVHTGEKWFDGYDRHPIVLFDDYTGSEFKLGYLLKLLDRYPMRVPVKGGFVQWVPKTIYFTSNKDPETWYGMALQEHQNALFRRIKTVEKFN